jgi:catechol 2,3-dioxygenase-like lactoylglutathione lyase family enzyme
MQDITVTAPRRLGPGCRAIHELRRLAAAFALALLFGARAVAGPVDAVESVAITVGDLDAEVKFYTEVLSFRLESQAEIAGDPYEHLYGVFGARVRIARLALGDERLELAEFMAPRGRPIPADSRSNDVWFQHVAIIVSDMARAYSWLREHGVTHASSGPQRLPDWNPNAGGIEAFYFRDPEGHNLEVLHFPAGKGADKWHRPSDALFLGIDHTAIVVTDTDRSLAFYRDALGLRVAGASENYGPEQERLNNVFGARLRITALRTDTGPGIELLEYLAPRSGRPMPLDTQASDLWYWQINLGSRELEAADRAVRAGHYAYLSPGIVTLDDHSLGLARGLTVRDPDGHALRFAQ